MAELAWVVGSHGRCRSRFRCPPAAEERPHTQGREFYVEFKYGKSLANPMHRVTRTTLGTVAIGLVAIFFVVGMVGGGLLGAPHGATGQTAKGSPVGSAGNSAAPLSTAARGYQTTIDLVFNTTLPMFTAVPFNFSFYTNISYGSIDSTHTVATVAVYLNGTNPATPLATFSPTITAKNVVSTVENGIPYANYTWFTALNEANLGCAMASCAELITAPALYNITVTVTENGASAGGGMASASTTAQTTLVSTFVDAGMLSPTSVSNPIPFVIEFYTNISWGWTNNASTIVNVQVSNDFSPFTAPGAWNFSFAGDYNTTNAAGFTSVAGFNGTLNGVPYSYTTWMMTLNNTTLGDPTFCTDFSCNTTLTSGYPINITLYVSEDGTTGGGLPVTIETPVSAATGMPAAASVVIGSTLINDGMNGAPIPYQPLPYVATGWLNVSWVNPSVTALVGNESVSGYVLVQDNLTGAFIGVIDLNNTVNITNADGASFMLADNGTTALGVPFQNYTWTLDLTNSTLATSGNVPYDELNLWVDITASGNFTGIGGWNVSTGPVEVVTANVFVQYPTTVSGTFTSVCTTTCSPTFSAYMPLPFTVNYTLSVVNAPITPATTTIVVNVNDVSAGAVLSSTPVTPIAGQTQYVFSVNAATLACNTASCGGLPQDEFGITVTVAVNGASGPTNGSMAGVVDSQSFFLIPTPLSASLVSPAAGSSVSIGNVTVSVAYLGSWVAGSVLNIYSSTNALVYSHGFVELTPGVPVSGTWFIGQAGTYSYSIVMTTVYLPTTHYFNGTISVISKGGTVYQNTSKYSNQSAISGLSGAAAGTILLVVGLIVGMIVALVLARAVMGRPAAAPPQPWESKPGGAAAPNTCSVCNKSFSTPEELAAHGKSEHGMQ